VTAHLTEDEIQEIVKEDSHNIRQILKILARLRKKFGKNVVTTRIKEKLAKRKQDENVPLSSAEYLPIHSISTQPKKKKPPNGKNEIGDPTSAIITTTTASGLSLITSVISATAVAELSSTLSLTTPSTVELPSIPSQLHHQ
jgi:pyridoxal/pyridoxine/pyridoxamine kinase